MPWGLADAPADYIDALLKAIVGIDIIEVTKLQGKWKLCQDEGKRDSAGVAAGLRDLGTQDAVDMADLVKRGS